jgi:hypothetical protein
MASNDARRNQRRQGSRRSISYVPVTFVHPPQIIRSSPPSASRAGQGLRVHDDIHIKSHELQKRAHQRLITFHVLRLTSHISHVTFHSKFRDYIPQTDTVWLDEHARKGGLHKRWSLSLDGMQRISLTFTTLHQQIPHSRLDSLALGAKLTWEEADMMCLYSFV